MSSRSNESLLRAINFDLLKIHLKGVWIESIMKVKFRVKNSMELHTDGQTQTIGNNRGVVGNFNP